MKSLISQHLVAIASVQEGLPTLSDDEHKQLLTLVLNESQMKAIYTEARKKHVYGPFGCGKTVVSIEILKDLARKFSGYGVRSIIFYVTCDPYSFVDRQVEKNLGKYSKVEIVCRSLHELYKQHINPDVSEISMLTFLKEMPKKFPNSHYIFDEIASKWLDKETAKSINELFEGALKDSHVIFCEQSMKKESIVKFRTARGFQELESGNFDLVNNLKHFQLRKVMRTTKPNQELITEAMNIIQAIEKKVYIPHDLLLSYRRTDHKSSTDIVKESPVEISDCKDESYTDINDTNESSLKQVSLVKYENVITSTSNRNDNQDFKVPYGTDGKECEASESKEIKKGNGQEKDMNENPSNTNTNQDLEVTYSIPAQKEYEALESKKITKESAQDDGIEDIKEKEEMSTITYLDHLDYSLKLMSTDPQFSQTYVETKFQFFDSVDGHGIGKSKPTLFILPQDFKLNESGEIIALLLQKFLLESHKQALICVNSMEMVKLFNYSLCLIGGINPRLYVPHLQQILPDAEMKAKVMKSIRNDDWVITDNRSFLGMETKVLFTIFDASDVHLSVHLRHTLLEILSRSTTHIYVLVINYSAKKIISGSAGEIINSWIAKNLVENCKVNVTNDCDSQEAVVITRPKKLAIWRTFMQTSQTNITIHTRCNAFEKFKEHTQSFEKWCANHDQEFQTQLFATDIM